VLLAVGWQQVMATTAPPTRFMGLVVFCTLGVASWRLAEPAPLPLPLPDFGITASRQPQRPANGEL